MKIIISLLFLFFITSFVFSQEDIYNWEGEYNYLLTSSNPNHVWHYDLKIIKSEFGYSAVFQVWGHQTFFPMKCSVNIEENRASFYFEDFTEPPGVNALKKGDLVLILENKDNSLYTKWSDVIRINDNYPKDGTNIIKKIKQ